MARVRVRVRGRQPIPYFLPSDRSGVSLAMPNYRLLLSLAFVHPEADARVRPHWWVDSDRHADGVIDTGAPLTTLGHQVWEPIADGVRWLQQPPTADGRPRRLTILGGRWAYRLGQVRLAAFDDEGRWLPPVWTPCLMLQEPSSAVSNLAVLGLRSPLLERRQLRHAGATPDDLPVYWLEDA